MSFRDVRTGATPSNSGDWLLEAARGPANRQPAASMDVYEPQTVTLEIPLDDPPIFPDLSLPQYKAYDEHRSWRCHVFHEHRCLQTQRNRELAIAKYHAEMKEWQEKRDKATHPNVTVDVPQAQQQPVQQESEADQHVRAVIELCQDYEKRTLMSQQAVEEIQNECDEAERMAKDLLKQPGRQASAKTWCKRYTVKRDELLAANVQYDQLTDERAEALKRLREYYNSVSTLSLNEHINALMLQTKANNDSILAFKQASQSLIKRDMAHANQSVDERSQATYEQWDREAMQARNAAMNPQAPMTQPDAMAPLPPQQWPAASTSVEQPQRIAQPS